MSELPHSKDQQNHSYQTVQHLSSCTANQQKKQPCCNSRRDSEGRQEEILKSQAVYIDNLQQQVFLLENQLSHLQSCMGHTNKCNKNGFIEVDILKKQVIDNQKEAEELKLDLKRKQVTIDYLISETERILKIKEENEAIFHVQKNTLLEELVNLRKEKVELTEKNVELEHSLQEKIQHENHLLGNCDNLQVQLEELKKELKDDKVLIGSLQESKKEAQKMLFDANLRLQVKSASDKDQTVKILMDDIQELHNQMSCAGRLADQEKLLRKQLADDNNSFIKRIATAEAELSEVKAKLREQEYICKNLEELNLQFVNDVAEIKSAESACREDVNSYKQQLLSERERNLILAKQLVDEQRFKSREEQRAVKLEHLIEQKSETVKARENENTELLRDNVILKDEVKSLKEQLKTCDKEVEELKQKVQKMRLSVEEFTECSKAASRLEGQRWMQLNQLAHGIQTLTKEAAYDINK